MMTAYRKAPDRPNLVLTRSWLEPTVSSPEISEFRANAFQARRRASSGGLCEPEETRPLMKAGFLSADMLIAAAMKGTPGVSQPSATDLDPTRDRDRVFPLGTFLRHLKLFRMTIQQDPYENDPWWFAPLLYAGTAVLIAAVICLSFDSIV